jgi:glycosyltransferase involved in cell wall biosynthesis
MTGQPVAAVVVRNTATHDARVLRCARALQSLGYETAVIAVTSEEEGAERGEAQGVPIVRLTPRAPLARIAHAARRVSSRSAFLTPPPGDAPQLKYPYGPLSCGTSPMAAEAGALARAYRLLRTLSYYRRGIAAMLALRPTVVHCNDYNTMWIGVGAKLLTGCAVIYDSHELWPDRNGRTEPRRWLLACEALFLRIADTTLATSPGHADAIARRHRVPAPQVVRNVAEREQTNGSGPSPDADSNDPGASKPAASCKTLVYAGAVTGSRGLEQAIAALHYAPGLTLRVVGPGAMPYREHLAELAARQGVADRLRLDRPVPPQRLVEEIATAAAGTALIQPSCLSYALSLPNKLFEYLAAGLPILAADVPVIRDFVEGNGVGLVVPANDHEAIARAMLEIVEPDRNRRLRAAVQEASARFSWESEAEHLKRAYRDAVAANKR